MVKGFDKSLFKNMRYLRYLSIKSRSFGSDCKFHSTLFDDLVNLIDLDLSYLPLDYISPETFKSLSRLRVLKLASREFSEEKNINEDKISKCFGKLKKIETFMVVWCI